MKIRSRTEATFIVKNVKTDRLFKIVFAKIRLSDALPAPLFGG